MSTKKLLIESAVASFLCTLGIFVSVLLFLFFGSLFAVLLRVSLLILCCMF